MRKSISYKKMQRLTRAWTVRLIFGLAVVYLAAIGILCLFKQFGGEPLLIVGFLCVFALMPGLLLVIFALPSRLHHRSLSSLTLLLVSLGSAL